MSQLNFYVPDELEEELRAAAQKDGKSISGFIADIVKSHFPGKKWPKNFFTEVCTQWEGEFPQIERNEPQEREEL